MRSAIALALILTAALSANGPALAGDSQSAPRLIPPAEPARPALSQIQLQALALDRAEADMLSAYRILLPQVSAENQAALAESQRRWNRYAVVRCFIDQSARLPRGARRPTPTQCRIGLAQARQAELRGALVTLGPWTFLRVVDHRVHLAQPEHGGEAVEETISRLQLAKPVNDGERRWNLATAHRLAQTFAAAYGLAEGDPRLADAQALDLLNVGDVDVQAAVEPVAVTPDLIEVSIRASADPAGPPPAQAAERYLIWSFKLGRALDATDLFDPKASWRPSLAQMAADRIDPAAAHPGMQALTDLVTDPGRWRLTPAGLAVDLRAPVGPPAASQDATALVPWPLLAPYLRRPFFLDPAALTEGPKG